MKLSKLPRPRRGRLRTHPRSMSEDEWFCSGRYDHHPDLKLAIARLFLNRPSREEAQAHAPAEFQEAFPGLVETLRGTVHWLRGEFDKADWQGRWRDARRSHEEAWVALTRAYESACAREGWESKEGRRERALDASLERAAALQPERARWGAEYRKLRALGHPVGVAQEMVAEKFTTSAHTVRRYFKG